MQSPLQILFIDDHIGLLEGISSVLQAKDSRLRFFLASSTEEAERILRANSGIALIVADLNIDGEDGIKAISLLKAIRDVPCVVYSMYADLFHVKAALAANVQGYVSKKSPTDELLSAILAASEGKTFYCTETAQTVSKLFVKYPPPI